MPTPVPHDDDIEPLWECDDLKVTMNIFSSLIVLIAFLAFVDYLIWNGFGWYYVVLITIA